MDELADRSVILVTLDSCRYDVAAAAHTPHLNRLGPVWECETTGTYTLPAHVALFTGQLPKPTSGRYHLAGRELDAIWRSAAARPTGPDNRIGVGFEGRTIMADYHRRGFTVIGSGGVTFFDPDDPANLLPTLFERFRYVGRPNRSGTVLRDRVIDRSHTLTLWHADELADECVNADRFFLFINCASTHVPYTSPTGRLTPDIAELLARVYQLHDGHHADDTRPHLTGDDRATLLDLQRHALEWADGQLGRLFDALSPRGPLVVVCADHGESFGEDGRHGHGHPHPTVTTVPLWCGLLGR